MLGHFAKTYLPGESLELRFQFEISVLGETLTLPGRCYVDRRKLVDAFGDCGVRGDIRLVALCIGARHDDGFLRESCVRKLLRVREPWVLPFVLAPLGEYVIEIIELIESALPSLDASGCAEFVRANPAFMATLRRRVISYWDCYFRRAYPMICQYPAYRALMTLEGMAAKSDSPVEK
ncbi:hypothetical protein OOZ63_18995 [Paucibacter sp. PLA-PC-4]|uniref:hypothetical protein n=1 Tax=Paucibacter sp. PLA-PC-4 TaxID=2993655 RepID=UPI00224AAAD3|nr:hypothetical protein [Paucibacter sp. PLA-PC-4]MCX2863918.1 hypothetical protein [Paucibacter sp. PLA-PC-4]